MSYKTLEGVWYKNYEKKRNEKKGFDSGTLYLASQKNCV